jgi:hypothetical protein
MKIETQTAYWILIVTSALVTLGIALNLNRELSHSEEEFIATPPTLQSSVKEAIIELDFNNGKKRMFAGELDTVYPLMAALDSISKEGKFEYKVKDGKIEEIAGVRGKWRIYHNGNLPKSPVEELTIRAGDRYALKLEK